ncbi:MAG: serine/threonine protein kinase [Planctomycetota bacterium]
MAGTGLLKYHIVGTEWVGRSSVVYRALDTDSQLVAIKMLLPETASSRTALKEMKREAELMLGIEHPHIVRAIEYVDSAPMPALVMEYFSSENLKTLLLRQQEFIREHGRKILLQACEAFAHVHERGLVHLDVKPENVLSAEDATTKIIDFALAKPIGKRKLLPFGRRRIAGTRPYIAPETIRRKAPDERTDIYSLGITIYEMLTGRPPFQSGDRDEILRMHLKQPPRLMRSHRRDISVEMDELVMQMLSKKRDRRPQDMHQVIRRLKHIQMFDN